jgi:hypothetical protein
MTMRTTLNSEVRAPEMGASAPTFATAKSLAFASELSSSRSGARPLASTGGLWVSHLVPTLTGRESRLTNHVSLPALATKPRSVMLIGMRANHMHPALRPE